MPIHSQGQTHPPGSSWGSRRGPVIQWKPLSAVVQEQLCPLWELSGDMHTSAPGTTLANLCTAVDLEASCNLSACLLSPSVQKQFCPRMDLSMTWWEPPRGRQKPHTSDTYNRPNIWKSNCRPWNGPLSQCQLYCPSSWRQSCSTRNQTGPTQP